MRKRRDLPEETWEIIDNENVSDMSESSAGFEKPWNMTSA
jgi:hypothetical protein